MGAYFKNLATALLGRNPYQLELDRVREEYEKTAEQVRLLDVLYGKVQKKLSDYEQLIENLRKRIIEKDQLMASVKRDFQERLAAYNEKIDELKKETAAPKKAVRKTRTTKKQ